MYTASRLKVLEYIGNFVQLSAHLRLPGTLYSGTMIYLVPGTGIQYRYFVLFFYIFYLPS